MLPSGLCAHTHVHALGGSQISASIRNGSSALLACPLALGPTLPGAENVGYTDTARKACSSAAEILPGDAAADVEQMVLGVVECVSDDGGGVDHLLIGRRRRSQPARRL